jgi:hypothetical protein
MENSLVVLFHEITVAKEKSIFFKGKTLEKLSEIQLLSSFCLIPHNVNMNDLAIPVGKQTHDLTVIASDSKTTQSGGEGGDNRKKFPLGAALQVPAKFFIRAVVG